MTLDESFFRILMPFLSLYLSLSLSLTSAIKASLSESHSHQKENIKGGAFLFVKLSSNDTFEACL
jgi:hypothetical protein